MVMRSVFDFLAELGVIDIRDVVRDGFIDMCVGFEDLWQILSFVFPQGFLLELYLYNEISKFTPMDAMDAHGRILKTTPYTPGLGVKGVGSRSVRDISSEAR